MQAAVHVSAVLHCTITPKVHLMQAPCLSNAEYSGGLGDKMEDWVECLHQTGMRLWQRFRTVQKFSHPHSCVEEGEFLFVPS